MSERNNFVYLVSGGISGTVAVIVTCPLEVVKTRLQSSASLTLLKQSSASHLVMFGESGNRRLSQAYRIPTNNSRSYQPLLRGPANGFHSVYRCISHILRTEGALGLFRGIGPTIFGVAPHKAIYFYGYNVSKKFMTQYVDHDNPINHIASAGSASFVAATITNPIWFIKTRLQLDNRRDRMTVTSLIRQVYRTNGLAGFYCGVSASYYGISETMIYFVTYEKLRLEISKWRGISFDDERQQSDYFVFMLASAVSRTVASCLTYPHEVARTRMREESGRYKHFWQTLRLVYVEEGRNGVYRGLFTALIRQIPNSAIAMATFETVLYYLQSM